MSRLTAIGLSASLLFAQWCTTSKQISSNRVRQLAPGVYCWMGDLETHQQTNCGWVVFKDYVLVIDSNFPWAAKRIVAEIRKTTSKPIQFVFNTHHHADHVYGNVVFAKEGAAIIASEDCVKECRSHGEADVRGQVENPSEPLVCPTVGFSHRMVFDDGEQRVELIRMSPAHTRGDAVAYLPRQKILFVGDLAVNWTHGSNVSDPGADYDAWLRVLGDLCNWDVKTVVPAHGDLATTEILKGESAYLDGMFKQVRVGIQEGRTVEQLVRENDLSRYKPFGGDSKENSDSIRDVYKYYTYSQKQK